MKKFFLFAAAAVAALSMNAASFTGFDARTTALGEQIAAGLATDLVNIEFVETSEGKYSANLVTGGQEGSFKFGGVQFAYTNSNAGQTAYKTYGTYIQPNGKDREIRIPVKNGESVNIVLTEACAGVLVNGASQDFVAGDNILTATQDGIVLKTVSTKPKIQAILPSEGGEGGGGGVDPVPGSFDGFSAETQALGEQIAAGLAKNLVNIEFVETSAGKYSANLVAGGQEGSFSFGGVVFAYTNSNAGQTAYKTYGTYIQPNGKDREIRIPAKAGEKVRILLTEACAGVLVDGESQDFVAGENILTATKDGIVLKTASTKPKFQAIQPAGAQGVENIFEEGNKAIKFIHNGQVVVKKGDRFFNLLGAEIAL
jgi:hypothetical protein